MDVESLLVLQQSNFPANFVGSFQSLREGGELFDVTLACDDQSLEAHKVLIAACSPFFRHVLAQTKQNHPFIYLKGVVSQDLVSLLDYVYTGEARVLADNVNRFIVVANELKIKGLAEELENGDNKKNSDKEIKNEKSATFEAMKKDTKSSVKEAQEDSTSSMSVEEDDIKLMEESIKSINEDMDYSNINHDNKDVREEEDTSDVDKNSVLKREIMKRIEKVSNVEGKLWRCTECGKTSKRRDNLGLHVETHLEGFTHSCMFCEKTCKTRNTMQLHMHNMHRNRK